MTRSQRCGLGVLTMLLALSGCGSSHSRFESYMASGQRYLAAGNLDKASVEFRNALQIEPKNSDAFYFNGRIAERRGNIRDAVEYYQAALDARPNDDRARASLAKAFVLGGATQRALTVVSPGLLEHPDDPDLLAARAAARHQLKDDLDARADAERAVQVAPTNENAISVLAALSLRANDGVRAVALVSEAVTKAPRSVDLRRILSSVYLSTGQPEKAEEQMRQLIALEPTEMTPRMQLASHLAQVGKLDEAQQVLEAAVRDLPHRDGAKLALVDFITTQRSRAQGEKVLRDFLAREPGNEELRLGLGTMLQRVGATQEAVATYREVIRRDGVGANGLAARDRLAAMAIAQGQVEPAKKLIGKVLGENPRDDDALILRANLELAGNDPTNAIVDLRSVLRDQPKSVVLQRSLARAYIAKGQPAMAEEALRAAIESSPEDVSIRLELAQVLLQTDRATPAVRLLEETVEKFPDNVDIREALVNAYIANHDLVAARAAAEELKSRRPEDAKGYYLAGLIAHDDHRPEDSEKNLERAYALQPTSLEILTSLTRISLARGRTAVAITRLQHAVDRDPKNVQLLDLLAGTYLDTKDLPRATETVAKLLAVDPHSWVAYRDLAQVRLAADDGAGAIQNYETALKYAPKQPRVVIELAQTYEKQGRIDAAIALYDTLYGSDPAAQPLAANNLAMLLVTYKTDKASLDRARALTKVFETSENASFLDTTGWVRFKRREYRDAVGVLERAADRSPDSKVIRAHLEEARSALAALKPPARSTG